MQVSISSNQLRIRGRAVSGGCRSVRPDGVNFSLYSSGATGVELLLFDKHDSPQPLQIIPLLPSKNKTFHFWHAFVKKLKAGAQ